MADKEFEEYRRQKQEEGRRQRGPAKAEQDPMWNRRDHLDLERSSKVNRSGAAKDAEGQAERGTIDQTITDKGYTQDR